MPGLDDELADLKRLRRRICSAANRTMWRAALQRRAVNIAALMRNLPALVVPAEFTRVRTPDGWLVTVAGADGLPTAVLEIVTRVGTRTLEQVRAVPVARVHLPEMVALEKLDDLERRGTVAVILLRGSSS